MSRTPLLITLFPYTTLFRSSLFVLLRVRGSGSLRASLPRQSANGRSACVLRGDGVHGADRKSTRLNSSHRCISYAVFCLKKKKIIMIKEELLLLAYEFNRI